MKTAMDLAPFVRIFLYVVTGWLASSWLDPESVDLIRSPEVVSAVTAAVVSVWYWAARKYGWAK